MKLFCIIFKVNHQLGTNRNARHQLERDLANKDNAISIGKFLKMSRSLKVMPIHTILHSYIITQSWVLPIIFQ